MTAMMVSVGTEHIDVAFLISVIWEMEQSIFFFNGSPVIRSFCCWICLAFQTQNLNTLHVSHWCYQSTFPSLLSLNPQNRRLKKVLTIGHFILQVRSRVPGRRDVTVINQWWGQELTSEFLASFSFSFCWAILTICHSLFLFLTSRFLAPFLQ